MQQAAADIQKLKDKMNDNNFPEVLEEFKKLAEEKKTEPKNEVSAMDAFLNAFL